MKESFVNFSQIFSGNAEDDLLAENSAGFLHITTFLSLDVCEDNLVHLVFPLSVEETDIERSGLPLLPLSDKKPRPPTSLLALGYGIWSKGLVDRINKLVHHFGFSLKPSEY